MAIKFKSLTKHGTLQFLPDVSVAFEDPAAEPYFLAAGFAESTDDEPKHTYSEGEVEIDPETRNNETGALVVDDIHVAANAEVSDNG